MVLLLFLFENIDKLILFQVIFIIIFIFVISTLYLRGKSLSKQTLKELQNNKIQKNKKIILIRKNYNTILENLGIAYFFFLPIPILIILLITGFFIWLLIYFQIASIAALSGIIIISFIMIISIIKSIHIPRYHYSNDFLIKKENAPELYNICNEITNYLNTDPIDYIYFDSTSNIKIAETGRLFTHIAGKNKRCLIIGLGVLKNLSIHKIKSIITHEAAHVLNHDTAESFFFIFSLNSINSALSYMKKDEVDNWYNLSWLYISLFKKIIDEISLGASRLQEYIADEISVELFGSEIFIESLLDIPESVLKNK